MFNKLPCVFYALAFKKKSKKISPHTPVPLSHKEYNTQTKETNIIEPQDHKYITNKKIQLHTTKQSIICTYTTTAITYLRTKKINKINTATVPILNTSDASLTKAYCCTLAQLRTK